MDTTGQNQNQSMPSFSGQPTVGSSGTNPSDSVSQTPASNGEPSMSAPQPGASAAQEPASPTPLAETPAQPVPPQTPPVVPDIPSQTSPSPDHAGSGKLVFVIVIILIILAAIGGYLLWTLSQNSSEEPGIIPVISPPVQVSPTEEPSASESAIEKLETVSDSNEVDALEEDVVNSDFSTLDEGVSNLEQEL